MARVKYPRAVTEHYPQVGQRRWVRGEFEVEVLGFEYAHTGTGQEQMARVWLDPQRCELDPDDPNHNQNTQDPKQLLTEEEAAHHNLALARWHQQQMADAERDLRGATARRDAALVRAVDNVRRVTGQDWGGAAISGHLPAALQAVLERHKGSST